MHALYRDPGERDARPFQFVPEFTLTCAFRVTCVLEPAYRALRLGPLLHPADRCGAYACGAGPETATVRIGRDGAAQRGARTSGASFDEEVR